MGAENEIDIFRRDAGKSIQRFINIFDQTPPSVP